MRIIKRQNQRKDFCFDRNEDFIVDFYDFCDQWLSIVG